MADYTLYTTETAMRWDEIAFKAFGDAERIFELMDANPQAEKSDIVKAGVELRIPVLDDATVDESDLPPWKRND